MEIQKFDSTQQTMSSREIAALTGKQHFHVIRDVQNAEPAYIQVFGDASKFGLVNYKAGNGEMRPEYQLTKSQTLFIVSGYDAVLRAKIQKRWEELEAENQNEDLIVLKGIGILQNRIVEQQKQLEIVNKDRARMAPRDNYVSAFFDANGTMSIGEMAKTFNIKPNIMFQMLRDDGYLIKRKSDWNIAKSAYVPKYFKIKIIVKNGNDFRQTRVTPRGHAYFAKKYGLFQLKLVNPI